MRQKISLRAASSAVFFLWLVIGLPAPVLASKAVHEVECFIKESIIKHVRKKNPELTTQDIKISVNNKQVIAGSLEYESYRLAIKPNAQLIGRQILPLNIYNKNGKFVKSISVFVDVNAFKTVVKTVRSIEQGSIITTADVRAEYLNLRKIPRYSFSNCADVVGNEAKGMLGDGVAISERMIRKVPDIREGDIIRMVVTNDNIELKLKGIALEDGYIGKTIRIQSEKFKKAMPGKVIDSKNVKVHINY